MAASEADLRGYVAGSGRDWNQLCQALMWNYCDQFGNAPVAYASALDAYYASEIESWDAYSAPVGAFVYYDIGAYGHVGFEVDSGDSMASSHVQIVWGINAGVSSIEAYVAATGATPLGWSWRNGVNTLEYVSSSQPKPPAETPRKKDTMQLAYIPKGASNGKDALFLLFGERFYLEFVGQEAANAFNTQIGGNTAPASRSFFDAVARAQGITNKVEVVNLDDAT